MSDTRDWDLNAPYAMGIDDYILFKKYVPLGAKIIVELGSGESSCQIAQDFPQSQIYSLESLELYQHRTRALLDRHGLQNAKVLLSPIHIQWWRGGLYRTYDPAPLDQVPSIDVLLIDGPVERLFPQGREAALYLLFERCRPGAIIGLDDYHRLSAKAAVRRWNETFGDSLETLMETNSFIVLRKEYDCHSPRNNIGRQIQSLFNVGKSCIRTGKLSIKEFIKKCLG